MQHKVVYTNKAGASSVCICCSVAPGGEPNCASGSSLLGLIGCATDPTRLLQCYPRVRPCKMSGSLNACVSRRKQEESVVPCRRCVCQLEEW